MPRPVLRVFWALDRALDRLTGGRFDELRRGPSTLRLTTTGRVSGKERENALYYLRDGDAWVVVASNAGHPDDPGWLKNLRARPEARVRVGRRITVVRPREATEAEASRLWPRLDAINPAYASYRAGSSRPIPIVILEPAR